MKKKEYLRKPCVAGRFYPGTRAALAESVASYLTGAPKEDAKVLICPHAGYMYSGPTAGRAFSSVHIPDRVILIGPNHTGAGPDASVMPSGTWEIPTGKVEIDEGLASRVLASSVLFKSDFEAHFMEHSLEVELPFIHALNPAAQIVPITVMRAGFKECEEMGKALAGVVSKAKERILIVVSSDMNHFEPDSVTRVKDKLAIEKVLALDAKGLLAVTGKEDITMCGVLPGP
jgi:AmmeMemoRadiSam system protein B